MSACNHFRSYLSRLASEGIEESVFELMRTFDEMHQKAQENTGDKCCAKSNEHNFGEHNVGNESCKISQMCLDCHKWITPDGAEDHVMTMMMSKAREAIE